MNRLFFASLFCTAVLAVTGCTAGSGPTFNAYSADASNGVRTYRAECHGLLESASTCMKVAQRICGDKAVQPIDRIDRVRAADDNRNDPRVLLFSCGQEAGSSTPAEAGPVVAEAATIEDFAVQADALFPFDRSAPESMLPAAKAQLDQIAERIRKHAQVSAITVVGHTDRLGRESINGPLSLARANTVRSYLVARGLDGSFIHAKGVGSSEPRTHCADGDARALIACLQPDRYVSITVQGRD
ncbi:outer membrane protein OmpA-like peptidoglycan-associated protein [Paraburkholderia sp. BL23I1N1]|uniref:OmpA family protein n=1 Tax=Paraburkholderia sp. BL23I1N1 TaxID=1938802 RepID=UPI000E75F4B4|nr:OmpA family protein [Paraburkholderia sp. BL23I1N1]RKE26240.1 outer membrane protein OmpA-like peptidoglycan-associated protein [Paraburkholderia sp. BL23I1N1]